MRLPLCAVLLFGCAFAFHLVWWRLAPPRRPLLALLFLFAATALAGPAAASFVPPLASVAPHGFWEGVHVAVVVGAVSLAYIVTYTAIEADSPTLTIVAYAHEAGSRGRSRTDLLNLLRDEQIVGARLASLLDAETIGPAEGRSDRYVLTRRGRRWAGLFDFFRRLYRLGKGG